LKYTADLLIDVSHGIQDAINEVKKLKKNNPFSGLDAVIVASDDISAFQFSADLLRKHGTLVVVGQPAEKICFDFHFFYFSRHHCEGQSSCRYENMSRTSQHGRRERDRS